MTTRTLHLTRRGLLKSAVVGTALVGSPAIIGRASAASANTAFAGENLIVVSWSGNFETSFRQTVIEPFNEKYGTKVETVGGWDQMVSQIVAAPADNPPFDVTIVDEYLTITGLAENIFLKTDRSQIAPAAEVHPWFDATRGNAGSYGVPFSAGSLWMLTSKASGIEPTSWRGFWSDKVRGKTTMDSAAFYWPLCIPAILSDAQPGIDELYAGPEQVELLFLELEKLRMAKWYRDGAELSNLMLQDEAQVAMAYSSGVYTFLKEHGDEFAAAIPNEGTASYHNWFMKVRGTKHSELADAFMAYLLEAETQQRFLDDNATEFMSHTNLKSSDYWPTYPRTDAEIRSIFNLFGVEGWQKFLPNYESYDARMKTTIAKTTEG